MLNRKGKWLATIAALAVLAMLLGWLWRGTAERALSPPSSFPGGATSRPPSSAAAVPAQAGLEERLRSAASELLRSRAAGEAKQRLTDLHQALSTAHPQDAVAAIRRFLDSKTDAPTRQGFKVGGKGFLDEAPTLRVFLLDELGRLDPAAAAAYGRAILATMDSPDEWAIALRNLAQGDTSADGRALLQQKAAELLQHEAWQQTPSVGYLEAFDAAVYLGGTKLAPILAQLLSKQDNPAVAHAAYLALDRLVINSSAEMLGVLAADPALMQGREQTRANYFARADVRDPQQRQVLENYLLDPRIGSAETMQFAGLYPNANYMISHNLLTQTPTISGAELAARDRESLRVVSEWLADARFASLHPQLDKMKTRLEEFVRQAQGR